MKLSTKMSKIFDAYAQRKGVTVASLKFLFDGDPVLPDETPESVRVVSCRVTTS